MLRSKSRDKHDRRFLERSLPQEHQPALRQCYPDPDVSRLSQLEEKMATLNGLDAAEEGLLKDINHNNQRLQNIINSIRSLMKVDPKSKRLGVSPIAKATQQRNNDRDKSSKRLIERVEKAISESNQHFSK